MKSDPVGFELFGLSSLGDLLGRYRRSSMWLVSAMVLASIGMGMLQWYFQRWLLGGLVTGFGVILGINTLALFRRRPVPIPIEVLFLFAIGTVAVAVLRVGVAGVTWAYPTLLMIHFLAPDARPTSSTAC